MAAERLSMRKIREILRQKRALGRSHREVAASLGVSVGIVAKTVLRATTAKLTWESVAALRSRRPISVITMQRSG